MKISIFIPLLLLGIPSIGNAQTCEDCRNKQYRYIGCSDGRKVTICTSSPRSTPNFRPWKKCFPIAADISSWTNVEYNVLFYDDGDPTPDDVVFSIAQAKDQIDAALDSWKNICSPIDNTDCDNCTPLKVHWARDEAEMLGYPGALAITHQVVEPSAGPSTCEVDCASSFIMINHTTSFLGITNQGEIPETFFYTNPATKEIPDGWYSFGTMMLHEIGHWLGFDHAKDGCGDPNGVISFEPGGGLPPETDWSFTAEDRCMFMKLYCCPVTTGIEEVRDNNSRYFDVYPTPSDSYVTVEFAAPCVAHAKRVRIINMMGQTVQQFDVPAGISTCRVETGMMSSGLYTVIVWCGDEQISSRKISVQK